MGRYIQDSFTRLQLVLQWYLCWNLTFLVCGWLTPSEIDVSLISLHVDPPKKINNGKIPEAVSICAVTVSTRVLHFQSQFSFRGVLVKDFCPSFES